MLQRAVVVGRSWLPPIQRSKRHVYHTPRDVDSTEFRTLTAASTRTEFEGDTEYRAVPANLKSPPLVDKSPTRAQKIFGKQFEGWRFGVLHFAIWASVVFLTNLVVTIWGSTSNRVAPGILMEGDCTKAKNLNIGLHILINVLSTVLLSGGNYCMQCLSAPTRQEVNKAHLRGTWLDIGIPSVRNVTSLSRQRRILWALFGLSSLPLHLFYNSAVYGTISSNDYYAFAVSDAFVKESTCLNCAPNQPWNSTAAWQRYNFNITDVAPVLQMVHDNRSKLERLSPAECIDQYASNIQSNRRHVLLVAGDNNFPTAEKNGFLNGSHVYWANSFYSSSATDADLSDEAYGWICSGTLGAYGSCSNNVADIRKNVFSWHVGEACNRNGTRLDCTVGAFPVDHCLSELVEPHCRVAFDTGIAVLVTILNFAKAVMMFYVAFYVRDEPLITMGDAVNSFLTSKDHATENMCLLTIKDVRDGDFRASPRVWGTLRYKWKDVTSKMRRSIVIVLFLVALIIVSALLRMGIEALPTDIPRSLPSLARLGFGTVDPRTAINGLPNRLFDNVLVANSPQLIFSVLYFSYNALFTAFLLSHEWNSYAHKRKGLRVSHRPIGAQRSTYFLQLPYRFSVPLMALSGALHWMISQSIFLVSIDMYDAYGEPGSDGSNVGQETYFRTCGYSPIAIISVIILGSFMVIGIIGFGYVPHKPGMTLAGSCSMAISAACHLDEDVDPDGSTVALEKLKWGVVGTSRDGTGHCSFSTKEVKSPNVGAFYAGIMGKR